MVKALFLGLLAFTMCAFASAVPPQRVHRSLNLAETDTGDNLSLPESIPGLPSSSPTSPVFLSSSRSTFEEDDPAAAVRSERSTNLSFSTGTARRIQMFIKNRHLQLLPDGTVNGTSDDSSVYTILHRISVGIGKLKIEGVATCQYLCMDNCGLLYGSREFKDECVFNEMIEQHHYNTYSSAKYSNEKRTLYLALNKRGQPRKVMLRARQQLGRLSSFTRVLTRAVSPERAEELHPLRHHGGHMCAVSPTMESATHTHHHYHLSSTVNPPTSHLPRCRKRKKRKKKKRKCPPDGAERGGQPMASCPKTHTQISHQLEEIPVRNSSVNINSSKCVPGDSDECQRVDVTEKKRQKTKPGDKVTLNNGAKKRKHPKGAKIKKTFLHGRTTSSSTSSTTTPITTTTATTSTTTTTTSTSPSPLEEASLDEDYAGESTTFLEYEYSTVTDSAVFPQPD
ncbi:uncharacterized protein LOC108733792 [Agrilus planipennis]|uniref:Fibroblast growth factor n=1 Tax=Agrilus planipennis TaxID=224129 RepID=A0A1W4WKE9_AGRPL|nr:uncharacterized protein LOC108733792 [Agrilus planipennis]